MTAADQAQYDGLKGLFRPGDIIASWSGTPVGELIEGLTWGGPSHLEMVIQSVHLADGRPDVEVFGATFGEGIDGCYRRPLSVTLAECKWATAYPLADRYRQILNSPVNLKAIYAAVGRWVDDPKLRYDVPGLFRQFLPALLNQTRCTSKVFCSAAVWRLLMEGGVVMSGLDYSAMTPKAVCLAGLASTQLALVGNRGIAGFVAA